MMLMIRLWVQAIPIKNMGSCTEVMGLNRIFVSHHRVVNSVIVGKPVSSRIYSFLMNQVMLIALQRMCKKICAIHLKRTCAVRNGKTVGQLTTDNDLRCFELGLLGYSWDC